MQKIYFSGINSKTVEEINTVKSGSWIRVVNPDADELASLEKKYELDADLLDDGVDLYEVPRIEREEKNLYIYIRYSRPESDLTSTHPLLIVLMPDKVMTVSRVESEPIKNLLKKDNIVTTRKNKLVLQILEEVNMSYRRHLNSVTKSILLNRTRLQKTIINNEDILAFIDTEEDLNESLAALQPYGLILNALLSGKYMKLDEDDEELVEDLQLSTNELIELTKSRLKSIQNIREAYNTIATNNLNKVFKRLTSIAIFMAVPTVVGGFYGMNIVLPYADHPQAFWIVSSFTVVAVTLFVLYFRRKKWL